jgi:hypothetical protein
MNAKKKKHIKKVVNIIFSVLTVVVLALAVYLFAGRSDNRVTFLFNRAFVDFITEYGRNHTGEFIYLD